MKTFKEYLVEGGTHGCPVISTEKNHADLKNEQTVNELNRSLLQVSGVGFVNPYNALEKVSKVLSAYGLMVPRVNMLQEPGGQVVFEMQQFGNHTGQIMKFDQVVNGIQTNSGIIPPQESDNTDPKRFLYFAYTMNENAIYECYAVILTSEEISAFVMN